MKKLQDIKDFWGKYSLSSDRIFGLDLLRAFSIWLVLLQHANFDIDLLKPLKIGGIGVEIFFVLSGFLIGGILFKEISKNKDLGPTLTNFWIRRWFRIIPLYYIVLIFNYLFVDDSIGMNIWYYLLFLQNNFYGIDWFGVSWSLVVEEWFYLVAPVFLIVVIRYFKNVKTINFMILFLLFINIIRFLYVKIGNIPYQGVNGNVPFRLDSMFLGVIMAYFNFSSSRIFESKNTIKLFILGIVMLLSYLFYYMYLNYHYKSIDLFIIPRTIGFFILPCSIALILPFFNSIKINKENQKRINIFSRFVTITSLQTYSIYLVHPFIYTLELNFILKITLIYIISFFTYILIESPMLKLRDTITSK